MFLSSSMDELSFTPDKAWSVKSPCRFYFNANEVVFRNSL